MTGLEIPLLVAGIGLQAYSSYQSGVDAKAQAETQAAFAERNAKISKNQADAQREANREADKQHARRTKMALSKMRTQIGKSGVMLEGSPLLVMEDTANQYSLERKSALEVGESRAIAFEQQSILDMATSEAYEERGRTAYRSGVLGAGASVLQGVGTMSQFQKPSGGGLTNQGKATLLKY